MNALNRFAEIADLVNSWADRLQKNDRGVWPERAEQLTVLDEMRAFSNGLRGTVEMFRPVVEAAEAVVAEHNVAKDNKRPYEPSLWCSECGSSHRASEPHMPPPPMVPEGV